MPEQPTLDDTLAGTPAELTEADVPAHPLNETADAFRAVQTRPLEPHTIYPEDIEDAAGDGALPPSLPAPAAYNPPSERAVDFTHLSLTEISQIAASLARTGFWRDVKNANQAVAKIIAGQEQGIPPMEAMAHVHIVEGKPTFSSQLIAKFVKRGGKYDYRVQRCDDAGCEIEWYERRGAEWETTGVSKFTLDDAQRAKLVRAGSGWEKYPSDMCFARALTQGARRYAPDAVNGAIYTPEELGREVTE